MAFKSYTRRSSAIIGAKRAGVAEDQVYKNGDVWGFDEPAANATRLPRLRGAAATSSSGADRIVEAVHASTLSLEVAMYQNVKSLNDNLGGLLTDIRDILTVQNSTAAKNAQADKLRKLEDDREANNKIRGKSAFSGILPGLRDSAKGLFDILKMLSVPFIVGALAKLEETTQFIDKTREKVSKWAGKAQGFLDDLASLPMFKDNIIGKGLRNAFPILGAFSIFALWNPKLATKGVKGLWNAVSWLGKNPNLTGAAEAGAKATGVLGKVGRVAGKIAIPVTIVTTLWETIVGAIDGWKKDGAFGAFEGIVNGLVHGLIGGLIDTVSQGIGWILEQFGVDAERFKNFSFAKFLDDFGSNLGVFMSSSFDKIGELFDSYLQGIKDIWNSDQSLANTIIDLVKYPFQYIADLWKREFGGLSALDAFKKMLAIATGNHAALRAVMSASEPPKAPVQVIDAMETPPPTRNPMPPVQAVISPQPSITGMLTGTSSERLEAEARKKGLTDAQIAYTYETDRLIGAPRGATLAQLKQESRFDNTARSPTGALGISQFTNIGVDDVLFGRAAANDAERAQRAAAKQSLYGNTDKGLEFQRALLLKMQKRSGDNWQGVMRNYNGDKSIERNGMQARDNYIARIRGFLQEDGKAVSTTPIPKPNTGAALKTATEQAAAAKAPPVVAPVIAPINNARTSVSNVQQNQLPNLAAATPVEFAPHVS